MPTMHQAASTDTAAVSHASTPIRGAYPRSVSARRTTGPKTVKTYEFEHELTYQARLDRIAWLKEQFKIAK